MTDIRRAIRESLPGLLADTAGDERNVVLTLARMWLTAATGDIAPKGMAAEWAEPQVPPEHRALLKYAREGYLGLIEDRWDEQEGLEALVACMKDTIEACLDSL